MTNDSNWRNLVMLLLVAGVLSSALWFWVSLIVWEMGGAK